MEEIILRQKNAAKPMDGKGFMLGVAGIVLRLAIAQLLINWVIRLTGVGLLNILFYVYAVVLLVAFMRKTVAGYVYTLKRGVLILEKKLGDSTVLVLEIPLSRVVSLRPVYMGERLETSYREVTVIDPQSAPTARVRAAFVCSLLSAHLAKTVAGKRVSERIGEVIVYDDNERLHACTFCPDETMVAALKAQLDEGVYGLDERIEYGRVRTLYGRALERAFPTLYPYVDPLVSAWESAWARDEIDAQKVQKARAKQEKAPKAPKDKRGGKPKKVKDAPAQQEHTDDGAQPGARRRRADRKA